MTKIKKAGVILGVVGFFFVLYFFSKNHSFEQTKVVGWHDFTGIENLRLKGVVYSLNAEIRNGRYHGRGIVRLRILKSNIKFYDPREKQINYYLIIKNGKAEVYSAAAYYMDIGDTILIDIAKSRVFNLTTGDYSEPSIAYPPFFEYIKEHGLQKF